MSTVKGHNKYVPTTVTMTVLPELEGPRYVATAATVTAVRSELMPLMYV